MSSTNTVLVITVTDIQTNYLTEADFKTTQKYIILSNSENIWLK